MGMSIIEGKWDRAAWQNKIYLYEIENGGLKEISSTLLDDERQFAFAVLNDEESLYVVGAYSSTKYNKYVFYLKPNDHLNFEVDAESYTLVGKKNSAENQEMKQWHDKMYDIEYISTYEEGSIKTYVHFIPLLIREWEGLQNYKVTHKVGKEFEKKFAEYRKYHLAHMVTNFFSTPRIAHPHADELPEQLFTITADKYAATDELMNYPWGKTFLMLLMQNELLRVREPGSVSGTAEELALIDNPTLKGEWALYRAKYLKDYAALNKFKNDFGQYIITPEQKSTLEQLLVDKFVTEKESASFDFTYKDVEGNEVSLSDFRGKYVYIDVWATWCGPCKREAPHWAELVEEFKGRDDIVFLGVSVDAMDAYDTWKAMVEDGHAAGIQLFAGEGASLLNQAFEIRGIPRFILIDKDGTTLVSNAARPSSDDIRPILNSLLETGSIVEPVKEAYDFTFRDIEGNDVSLSDFKGKNVYIDVWATWCGPCKAEAPHWKRLAEEYKDRTDIIFLGVSVDKEEDYDKWATAVKSGDLAGIQIFAGKDSGMINRAYEVTGIPRFIVVDKEGKINLYKAPRPSSDQIRGLLDSLK